MVRCPYCDYLIIAASVWSGPEPENESGILCPGCGELFILKSVVRLLGLIGLAAILPFAAFNPAVENQWIIWVIGAILALNIVSNDPMPPN